MVFAAERSAVSSSGVRVRGVGRGRGVVGGGGVPVVSSMAAWRFVAPRLPWYVCRWWLRATGGLCFSACCGGWRNGGATVVVVVVVVVICGEKELVDTSRNICNGIDTLRIVV